jgi:hypothetical protein
MLLNLASQEGTIRYGWEDLSEVDDPERIRWRAIWDSNYTNGLPGGIFMECYPVVRKTRCGAWIDPHAYRQATKQPWEEGAPVREWNLSDKSLHRFVHDGSGSAWAKPTRADALHSLGVRLTRWSARARHDVERVNAACDVAAALLTEGQAGGRPVFHKARLDSGMRIRLADDDSALAAALRHLVWRYNSGQMEKCDAVEAVVKSLSTGNPKAE